MIAIQNVMLDLKFCWETLGLLHMHEFAESGYAQLHAFPQFLGVGWLIHRCFFGSSWVLLSRSPRLEMEVDDGWGESAAFSVDEEEMDVCCRPRIICLYLLVFCLLTSMICFLF